MNIGRLKNIILIFLIFLAVWQTSRLWFEDSAGSGILAGIYKPKEGTPESGLKRHFAYPMRVVTGDGSGRFFISYSMADNAVRKLCDTMIEDALKNGTAERLGEFNWSESLTQGSVVYEYNFEIPTGEFIKAMGLRSSGLSSDIEVFDTILIQADEGKGAIITWYDSNSGNCVRMNTNLLQDDNDFQLAIGEVSEKHSAGVYYVSSVLEGIESAKNFFIPAWEERGCYYVLGKTDTDYYDSSVGVEKSAIRSNMESFFDNPSAVIDATTETIASGDENTIVKYYSNDVLEYTSYKWDSKNTGLLDDYALALDFIAKRDVRMTNEIYLSHCDELNGERHFYFDYVVNDLPVIFSEQLKSLVKDQITSGIKVIVREGSLVGYTRLAYNFSVIEEYDLANWDIPGYIRGSGADLNDFKSITLGYSANEIDLIGGNNKMSLHAEFMTVDGISSVEALRIDMN